MPAKPRKKPDAAHAAVRPAEAACDAVVPHETAEQLMEAGMNVTRGSSRKSARKISDCASSAGSVAGSIASSTLEFAIVFSGKVCLLCKTSEKDPDPVKENQSLKWAYPPDPATKQNVGEACMYCCKVYRARFRGTFKTHQAVGF